MIYSNPLNESNNIILKGIDADSFLEFFDITLFTDAIVIGEIVMDGIIGEKILVENGITLNEDHIVLEGEQAEAYKARKAKEKEDAKKVEDDRYKQRYFDVDNPFERKPTGNKYSNQQYHKLRGDTLKNNGIMVDDRIAGDIKRENKTKKIYEKERTRRASNRNNSDNEYNQYFKYQKNERPISDAINRNMRRHHKQYSESTIFRYADLVSE